MKHASTPLRLAPLMLAALAAQGSALAQGTAEATTDGTDGLLIYNENKTLQEGETTSGYNLRRGVYLAEITSTGRGGGVKVEWVGASCPTASETHYYHNLCALPSGGSLVITNPSQEWMGNETVTVVIKKMAATISTIAKGFVVANEIQKLNDGATRSFTLAEGSYQAAVRSNRSGVQVVWEGTQCSSYSESKNYLANCTVPAGGKVTITNPQADWRGMENTTIFIKKVGSGTLPNGTMVASETQVIAEETSRVFKFSPGTYRIKLSGVTNGISVNWSDKRCPGATNVIDGSFACAMTSGGTLTVSNPTVPHWIGDETVTFKITKTR